MMTAIESKKGTAKMYNILFHSEALMERHHLTLKYHSECCDKYINLLGDIEKYGLGIILDWGETYITNLNGIRINHLDDEENVMLFNFHMCISKEDKLNETFKINIKEDEFYNKIIINGLKPKELKDVLFKIFGY